VSLNKKFQPRPLWQRFPAKLLLLIFMLIVAVYVFGYIVHEVMLEREAEFDARAAEFFRNRLVNPEWTPFMKTVTAFGSKEFLIAGYALLCVWYLVRMKQKRTALDVATIGISGFVVSDFLKYFFARVRPPDPLIEPLKNYSFPSGHASSGFIFYGLLAWLVWKSGLPPKWKYFLTTALLLFSLLIGFSRIYLRIHYATDVIAGFCIGFVWLTASLWLLDRFRTAGPETDNRNYETLSSGRKV